MRTRACLDVLARTRELVDVPIVPMTYAAILEAYGYERFADRRGGRGRVESRSSSTCRSRCIRS